MGSEGRRKFDREFKIETVRLIVEGGRKISEVARNFDIHENVLRKWKQQYQNDRLGTFPGKGNFHSDRGSQYASIRFRNMLSCYGIVQSVSGKGNCYDNAYAESFFGTLKTEPGHYYESRSVARQSIASVSSNDRATIFVK